jgi:hypothetical protein
MEAAGVVLSSIVLNSCPVDPKLPLVDVVSSQDVLKCGIFDFISNNCATAVPFLSVN